MEGNSIFFYFSGEGGPDPLLLPSGYVHVIKCGTRTWADPEGRTGVRTPPHGNIRKAIGFLRNTGTDPTQGEIGPKEPNFFSGEVYTTLCEK